MHYGVIFFGAGTSRVSLPVLEKVQSLVEDGAVLVGARPQGSPSLAYDPARVKTVLDTLWPGSEVTRVGRGRVFADAEAGPALTAIGLTPDFTYVKPEADSHVMFIHRRLSDGDAYFLSNRIDRTQALTASFRVSGRIPELWDPATGLSHPASYRTEGERTEVTVPLDRFGSLFVMFRTPLSQTAHADPASHVDPAAHADPISHVAPQAYFETLTTLSGPWPVAFQPDRGAPPNTVFPALADFRDNSDPGIRYFSGIATYTRELRIAPRHLAHGQHLWLDFLGQVDDLAEVWLNRRLAGTAWKPPYRVDLSGLAKPGRNQLEIRVVNLWVNRLIGDVQPGTTGKITFTQADGKVAPGTLPVEAASQLRMPYAADAPLRPSGLIGPVTLLVESEK